MTERPRGGSNRASDMLVPPPGSYRDCIATDKKRLHGVTCSHRRSRSQPVGRADFDEFSRVASLPVFSRTPRATGPSIADFGLTVQMPIDRQAQDTSSR